MVTDVLEGEWKGWVEDARMMMMLRRLSGDEIAVIRESVDD